VNTPKTATVPKTNIKIANKVEIGFANPLVGKVS
jgi:hypothetical protein